MFSGILVVQSFFIVAVIFDIFKTYCFFIYVKKAGKLVMIRGQGFGERHLNYTTSNRKNFLTE